MSPTEYTQMYWTKTHTHTHTGYPQFGHEVEAHAVEELVLLQHHCSQRIHLLHVKVEVHSSRRVAQEVPLVLRRAVKSRGI